MSDSIRHRGPDEGGLIVLDGAILGSRRLSILDLAGGRQPIANETGTVHVVHNGEIYDHDAHRQYLESCGHRFRTRTDTEILVHAYEERGLGLINGLNGMFGFALYDVSERRLILARDRLGIKPLYYALREGRLWFASELKALMQIDEIGRDLDPEALSLYLTLESVPAPLCILQGVSKLPPGHMALFQDGVLTIRRYWDVPFVASTSKLTFHEARERLDQLLDRAVRRRLVADVPVGVFLSGGIDSSTVAWYASRAGSDIRTFSIGFEESSFDESSYARSVASHLGTRHEFEILSANRAIDMLDEITAGIDEPFADASIIPTYLLSRFARQHVKVALGGDGGDEVFLGYPTYYAHQLFQKYQNLPAWLRDTLIPGIVDLLPVSRENISFEFKIRRFISGRNRSLLLRNVTWLGSFSPELKTELLVSPGPDPLAPDEGPGFLENLLEGIDVKGDLDRVAYLDMKTYMSEDILTKVDRASMANSLEVRTPLLDHEVVELVTSLPTVYKLNGSRSKVLLKELMRSRLPDHIINRPKKGFGMPVGHWIRGPLRERVRDRLSRDRMRQVGLFNPEVVTRLLDEHDKGIKDHRKLIWTLFMFETWRETWLA